MPRATQCRTVVSAAVEYVMRQPRSLPAIGELESVGCARDIIVSLGIPGDTQCRFFVGWHARHA